MLFLSLSRPRSHSFSHLTSLLLLLRFVHLALTCTGSFTSRFLFAPLVLASSFTLHLPSLASASQSHLFLPPSLTPIPALTLHRNLFPSSSLAFRASLVNRFLLVFQLLSVCSCCVDSTSKSLVCTVLSCSLSAFASCPAMFSLSGVFASYIFPLSFIFL